jgi:hypothetical protein
MVLIQFVMTHPKDKILFAFLLSQTRLPRRSPILISDRFMVIITLKCIVLRGCDYTYKHIHIANRCGRHTMFGKEGYDGGGLTTHGCYGVARVTLFFFFLYFLKNNQFLNNINGTCHVLKGIGVYFH